MARPLDLKSQEFMAQIDRLLKEDKFPDGLTAFGLVKECGYPVNPQTASFLLKKFFADRLYVSMCQRHNLKRFYRGISPASTQALQLWDMEKAYLAKQDRKFLGAGLSEVRAASYP